MASKSGALIKNPKAINAVSFENNILQLKTSVCSYSSGLAGKTVTRSDVPGQMTVELSAYGANAIKVRYTNHRSGILPTKRYIDSKASSLAKVEETENNIVFKTNMFEARISKSDVFGIDFYYYDKFITSSRADNGGASYTTTSGVASNYKISNKVSTGEALTFSPDEQLYGLGSNGASLLLNGSEIHAANKAGLGTKASDYQKVPFYLSSAKYGVFVNTIDTVDFSFGTQYDSAVSFSTDDEELEYVIFVSEDMMGVLGLFNSFLGVAHPAPFWSLGTSVLFTDDKTLTADDILNYIDKSSESGIQLNEIWLSNLWLSEADPLGFSFDLRRFPNPQEFCRKVHEKGVMIGLTVSPYISDSSEFYDECIDNDLLIKTSEGHIYMRDYECASVAMLDLTNIGARSFVQQRVDSLLLLGVDMIEAGFRYGLFDFDDDEVVFSSGFKASEVNDSFSMLFNESVYEAVSRTKGHNNAMVISNAISTGAQLYPYTNVIAENNTFAAMSCALKRCLSLGLSGITTVNIDIPLLTPGKDDTLFVRWAQFGLLVPHMRFTVDGKTPLSAFKGAAETIKLFAGMRKGMLPHFYSITCEAATLGAPSMRPVFLEFEHDLSSRIMTHQYMLGQSLMIVPILNASGNASYYVPSGIWTNLMTREKIQGPCYKNIKADSNSLPILVRPNSIVVTTSPDAHGTSELLNNVTFSVFELANDTICAFEVFSEDASHSGVINILKEGQKITVRTKGFGTHKRIVLSGVKNVVSVSESMPNVNDWGTSIDFTSQELVITLG